MPEQTDTDTIYILSENAPAQIDNMVGLTDQLNLPTGYSRTRPDPTPSRGVWQVQRTRRFNVEPLALSQANVLYDKTQASTTTLNAATGGEIPITYSLPLLRGSQDRFDVPGAPVTFDAATRELNIGSGFDEGLEVNYTARDACDQVANARAIIRPMGTEHDDFDAVGNVSGTFPDYTDSIGRGETVLATMLLDSSALGLAPYTLAYQTQRWADAGWEVEIASRDPSTPETINVRITYGDWFLGEQARGTRFTININITDFLERTDSIPFSLRWT